MHQVRNQRELSKPNLGERFPARFTVLRGDLSGGNTRKIHQEIANRRRIDSGDTKVGSLLRIHRLVGDWCESFHVEAFDNRCTCVSQARTRSNAHLIGSTYELCGRSSEMRTRRTDPHIDRNG